MKLNCKRCSVVVEVPDHVVAGGFMPALKCKACIDLERARSVATVHLRHALSELTTRFGLANSGHSQSPVDEIDIDAPSKEPTRRYATPSVEMFGDVHSKLPSGFALHFRLPRWNGKAEIPVGEVIQKIPAFATDRLDHEGRQQLVRVLEVFVAQGARELRGRALVELLDKDWEISQEVADPGKEGWQRLERVALKMADASDRLMQLALKEKK